jgi:hypothetical protein
MIIEMHVSHVRNRLFVSDFHQNKPFQYQISRKFAHRFSRCFMRTDGWIEHTWKKKIMCGCMQYYIYIYIYIYMAQWWFSLPVTDLHPNSYNKELYTGKHTIWNSVHCKQEKTFKPLFHFFFFSGRMPVWTLHTDVRKRLLAVRLPLCCTACRM